MQKNWRSGGFTLIELLLVITVITIIAVISIPSFLAAKKASNESAAISAMRALSSAQSQYRTRYGSYASIADLTATGTIDTSFSDGARNGYGFSVLSSAQDAWSVLANPLELGVTGDRSFFVDESGVLRFAQGMSATSADAALD